MEFDWAGSALALIIMVIGLAGVVLPFLPGAPLIILGMLTFGLFYGFHNFTWVFWVGQGLLTVMMYVADYIASVLDVKHYGGYKAAALGCMIGGALGLLTMGPLGSILGSF